MILRDAGLKEVLLLLEIHHLGHPRERIGRSGIQSIQTNLVAPTVADELHILVEHVGIEAKHAARHGVMGVANFQLGRFTQHLRNFRLELCRP